jgi:hypothetical protein
VEEIPWKRFHSISSMLLISGNNNKTKRGLGRGEKRNGFFFFKGATKKKKS